MIIDVQQAEIKTASVEIKSLTVSGKQLTLAVFRQLQEKYVLDDDAKLRGRVWGKVNYFWGDCAKGKEHLHVVWQDGDELFRCCFYTDFDKEWVRFRTCVSLYNKLSEQALAIVTAMELMGKMGDDSWGESGVINYGNGVSVIVVYGDELRDVHNYRVNLTYNYHSPEHTNRMADRRSGLETSFCVYLDSQGINFDGSLEDGYTALCAERNKTIEKIRAFDCEFSSSLFAIESAPQLFIAV